MAGTKRSRVAQGGVGVLLVGILLAIAGLIGPPVQAGPNNQVTICHATGSAKNPYVAISPNAWQIVAPNGHANHPDDIIPAFGPGSQGAHSWGPFAGQNLHLGINPALGCVAAAPATTATTPTTRPTSTSAPTTIAPSGQPLPSTQVGTPGSSPSTPDVVAPAPGAAPSPLVEGVQVTPPAIAEPAPAPAVDRLPRTGTGTGHLAEFGFGFVLLGIGMLLLGREDLEPV